MRCPLTFHLQIHQPHTPQLGVECIRTSCQWFDPDTDACAVFALAKHYQLIADQYEKKRPWRPQPGGTAVKRKL